MIPVFVPTPVDLPSNYYVQLSSSQDVVAIWPSTEPRDANWQNVGEVGNFEPGEGDDRGVRLISALCVADRKISSNVDHRLWCQRFLGSEIGTSHVGVFFAC